MSGGDPAITFDTAVNAGSRGDGDAARSERAIQSLIDASDTSPEEVRDLFKVEFSRLERVAKVRTYLHVLATAKVRAFLHRRARASSDPPPYRS